MYNCITLIGNLGADPEIKNTSAGKKFAILSLATNRTVASEKQTDWHKIVVWDDKIADILQRYTKKGERVLLEGRLTYRKYQTESGEEKEKAEVHLDPFGSRMVLLGDRSNVSAIKSPDANDAIPSDSALANFDDDVPL
ncbi:single-stranded DNA-binding protein (TIGR00621) [uncultured Mediterranean phage uvMED]|nr:single-stranded DNA-binding protein (TIGR00621) [uncultured Mediterranean phage uvMED]